MRFAYFKCQHAVAKRTNRLSIYLRQFFKISSFGMVLSGSFKIKTLQVKNIPAIKLVNNNEFALVNMDVIIL